LVEKTTGEGKGQLIKDAERELADDETVTAHAMKSIITVPLITSGRVLGAIYLDNRQVKGLFTEENFELLKAFAIEAAISIENVRLYARVQETAKREQELEIATDIQTSILPEVLDTDAYEMGAYMRTATEVGGDYYDFEIGAEPYFGVFGDVSGHGLQSGIVMMMSEVAFKTLMSDPGLKKKPLPELYQMINATLYENIQQRLSRRSAVSLQYSHMYMTFHLFRFDTDGNFEIFGNDHAEPFICRAGSGEVIPIASRGFLMGILDEAVQGDKSYRFKLGPGDLLVLYSDGITEARLDASAGNGNGDGKQSMFGEKKLHSLIADHRGRRPQQIIDTVMRTLDSWTAEQEDDITMAVIKRRE
jgi:sigma-B regulation protein RsbU (phosphoserine phosphatase)